MRSECSYRKERKNQNTWVSTLYKLEVECKWKRERERIKSKRSPKEFLEIDVQCNHSVFVLMNENAMLLYFIKSQTGRTNLLQGPCAAAATKRFKHWQNKKTAPQTGLLFLTWRIAIHLNIAQQHPRWNSFAGEPAAPIMKIEDDEIFLLSWNTLDIDHLLPACLC